MMTVLQECVFQHGELTHSVEDFRESRLYSSAGHPGTAGGRGLYRRELRALSARWRRALSALLLVGISPVREPGLLIAFGFFGAGHHGGLGLITALWAEKYDQMGAVMNFVIMPLTFLSGVFYSVDSLPPFWQVSEPPQSLLLLGRRLSAGIFRERRHQHDAEPTHRCRNGFGRHGGRCGAPR